MADKDFIVKNGLVTGSNTVTLGTAVTFASNGNVGFGNTTPTSKITVTGNVSAVFINASSGFYGTVQTATQGTIDHNSLANYSANQHVDHTTVSISTGNGLTGGGTIASTRSLSVVAGTGAVVNSTGVHVNSAYIGTLSANNTTYVNGKTEGNLNVNSASYATSAGSATNASAATNATYATSAGSATNASAATNATYATSAGSATNATYAGTAGATTTTNNFQMNSLGVGTGASGTAGEIRATDDITAYYSSDASLKENVTTIENALEIIMQINGVYFDWKEEYIQKHGGEDGYFIRKHDIGVIAQQLEKVLPEVVATRKDGIKAVKYDRIVALLIEGIKELSNRLEVLENTKK